MADLYEYYNTGDDTSQSFYSVNWAAQTFTPATAHKITSVKLKLFRGGSPGTVTVSIRATDENGHPNGEDLCSGTIDGNTLTTDIDGEWYEITLGDGYNLDADTKYAIVVRAPDGSIGNIVSWRFDSTSPTYAGGNFEYSVNSGSSWTSYTDYDFMFEDWGEPLIVEKTSSDTGTGVDTKSSGNPVATVTKTETGSGVDALTSMLAQVIKSDSGSGVDALTSLVASLIKSDTGLGVEQIELSALILATDLGVGVELTPIIYVTVGRFPVIGGFHIITTIEGN